MLRRFLNSGNSLSFSRFYLRYLKDMLLGSLCVRFPPGDLASRVSPLPLHIQAFHTFRSFSRCHRVCFGLDLDQ